MIDEAVRQIHRELNDLPVELRTDAHLLLKSVTAKKHRYLMDITALFGESLLKPVIPSIEPTMAQIYMWMTYTLYDDILDADSDTRLLPLANILQRSALKEPSMFDAFLKMDCANAWEITHTRASVRGDKLIIKSIPDYGDGTILADRAYGHIAGCVEMAGQDFVRQGLSYYLLARQLNDDLHDWVEDIQKGHLSFVVTSLLQTAGVTPGAYDSARLISGLKRALWETELDRLCHQVIGLIDRAKQALRSVLVADSRFEQRILLPVAQAARVALDRHLLDKQLIAFHRQREV